MRIRCGTRGGMWLALLMGAVTGSTAEPRLYVCPVHGDDAASGTTRNTPLATAARAVARAAPGSIITLLPGWHEGGIDLPAGEPGHPVILRGARRGRVFVGRPAEIVFGWEPVPGFEYAYAAEAAEPHNLMEASTGVRLRPMPSLWDVEHLAGTFYYAEDEGRLYVHPSDSESARRHLYSIPSPEGTGITLADHVIVENLVVTGMGNAAFVARGVTDVTVRDCLAYGNGYAVRLNGVEDARVYRNHFWWNVPPLRSQVVVGQGPGDRVNRNIVFEENRVHDSPMAAIRFYSTGPLERGVMRGNLIGSSHSKGVPEGSLYGERNVSLNTFWAHEGGYNTYVASPRPAAIKDTDLVLIREGEIFRGEAFAEIPYEVDNAYWRLADPRHLDFRLQSDSPARGAAPGGSDLGAFQFEGSVLYVAPDGDDDAAGTSERTAWRTLAHAVAAMRPGQTLYIAPGRWDEPLILRGLVCEPDQPARVRVIRRADAEVPYVAIEGSAHVVIEGLAARGPRAHMTVTGSRSVTLKRCAVVRTGGGGAAAGFLVVNSAAVRLHHVAVSGPGPGLRLEQAPDAELISSVLAARGSPQIELSGDTQGFWSAFNAFVPDEGGQLVYGVTPTGTAAGLDAWRALSGVDLDSHEVSAVDFQSVESGDFTLIAGRPASFAGRYAKPAGPRRVLIPRREREPFERIDVISTTRTSANLTWWTPGRITGTIVEWGTCPAYGNIYDRSEYERGEYETFHTASILGLDPETTYHFRVGFRDHGTAEDDEEAPLVWSENGTFTTTAADSPPRALYVAIDGDDARDGRSPATAWRTLAHAAREARAGDTVTIAPGRYLEVLRPLQSGVSENRRITFRAERPLTVFLDGGFVRNATGRSHCAQIMGKAYITLENLVFDRAARDDNGGYRGFPGHAGLVRISGSSGIEIRSCVLDGRRRYMVGLMAEDLGAISGVDPETVPLTVTDSLFLRNWYAFLVDGRGPVVMRNNALIRNLVLMARFQTETVLRNNIFQSLIPNKQGNRMFSNAELMDSNFNCFAWDATNARRNVAWIDRAERTYASGLDGFRTHFGKDLNSIEADPGYGLSVRFGFTQDEPDGELSMDEVILPPASPCRGAGENGEDIGPRWDRFIGG